MKVCVSPPAEVLVEGKGSIEWVMKGGNHDFSSGFMTGYRRGIDSSQIYFMMIRYPNPLSPTTVYVEYG